MICYCKQEIAAGNRHLIVSVIVDWGQDDLRETQPAKVASFHSFECLGLWAADRARAHDDVIVKEGVA